MKQIIFLFALLFITVSSCKKSKNLQGINFRAEMVKFVNEISIYGKSKQAGFVVVPQNGEALAAESGYMDNVDAVGIEDLSYGYDADGIATPEDVRNSRLTFLNLFRTMNKPVLVTDYVFSNSEDFPQFDNTAKSRIDNAYQFSLSNGFIPYATVRNLNYLTINPGHEPAVDTLKAFTDAKSFLY